MADPRHAIDPAHAACHQPCAHHGGIHAQHGQGLCARGQQGGKGGERLGGIFQKAAAATAKIHRGGGQGAKPDAHGQIVRHGGKGCACQCERRAVQGDALFHRHDGGNGVAPGGLGMHRAPEARLCGGQLAIAQPIDQARRGAGVLVKKVRIVVKALRCLPQCRAIHGEHMRRAAHQQRPAVGKGHIKRAGGKGRFPYPADGFIPAPKDAHIAQAAQLHGHILPLAGVFHHAYIGEQGAVRAGKQALHRRAGDTYLLKPLAGSLDDACVAREQRGGQRVGKIQGNVAGRDVENQSAPQPPFLAGVRVLQQSQVGAAAKKGEGHHIRIGFGLRIPQQRSRYIRKKRQHIRVEGRERRDMRGGAGVGQAAAHRDGQRRIGRFKRGFIGGHAHSAGSGHLRRGGRCAAQMCRAVRLRLRRGQPIIWRVHRYRCTPLPPRAARDPAPQNTCPCGRRDNRPRPAGGLRPR